MEKLELKRYRELRREIDKLEDRLLEVECEATKITQTIKQDPVSGGGVPDKLANHVTTMVEIKDKINETIVESLKEAHRIEMAIRRLEPVERNLLRSRYIEGRSWEEICVEMCYSWRNIHNIHSRALIKLKECTQLHT